MKRHFPAASDSGLSFITCVKSSFNEPSHCTAPGSGQFYCPYKTPIFANATNKTPHLLRPRNNSKGVLWTGTNTAQDRIVQIGAIKIGLDGVREEQILKTPAK